MAGAGYKLFNTGDVLTAAQVNTYLQEQVVMVFASATARTTALSGVLSEGMVSYLQDTNAVEVYNGSAWVGVSGAGDVTEVQAGTGISVASGTGPVPIVTNTMATAIDAAGDLIYGTGADTFARLGIGTAGQVLKVNSGATAPEWGAAGGSSGLTLISRQTGSAASSIDFNGVFTSTYQAYMIVIENLTGSTAEELRMQLKYSTSTVQSSGYYGNTAYVAFNSSTWTFYTQSNTAQCILMDGSLSSAPTGATLFVTPGNSAVRPAVYGYGMNSQQGGPSIFAFQPASQTYTGFLIKPSAGTITGSVSCYGLAKS